MLLEDIIKDKEVMETKKANLNEYKQMVDNLEKELEVLDMDYELIKRQIRVNELQNKIEARLRELYAWGKTYTKDEGTKLDIKNIFGEYVYDKADNKMSKIEEIVSNDTDEK